ncbi:MAG TPA: hypothetical protein VEI27_01435, partial [Dehalococcoidales bacterium]|nr:hypothetical protein [Dehalococcoidales bacterium]
QPDGPNARLYGRYDNNGDAAATPGFWQDDSQGYRFASMVQASLPGSVNEFWQNVNGKKWVQDGGKWKMVDAPLGLTDEMTWECFAYSIKATHEPQLVTIWSSAGGGHAMVVYRVNNGTLYIADPNYPGNTERRINYANGTFQPYNSGANADEIAAGRGKSYEKIMYYAKSTVIPWSTIEDYWTDMKNGTAGDGTFPIYEIKYMDDKGQWAHLSDGTKTPFDAMAISASSSANVALYVYRNGQVLPYDAKLNYDLVPGNNKLGIYVVGKVNDSWKFVDFQYINVNYEAESTTTTKTSLASGGPPIITGITGPTDVTHMRENGATVTFTVKISGGKPPYKEDWSADLKTIADGAGHETITVPVSQLRYNGAGWWIYLTVSDSTGAAAGWIDNVGNSHNEFVYGLTLEGVVTTEPTFPYKSIGSK